MADLALIESSTEPYARNQLGDMGRSPHVLQAFQQGGNSGGLLSMPSRAGFTAKNCHETIGCYSRDRAYVAMESRDALSLGNLKGERSHFAMRLGGVIRDSSLDSP
jgi:hypothetical protein